MVSAGARKADGRIRESRRMINSVNGRLDTISRSRKIRIDNGKGIVYNGYRWSERHHSCMKKAYLDRGMLSFMTKLKKVFHHTDFTWLFLSDRIEFKQSVKGALHGCRSEGISLIFLNKEAFEGREPSDSLPLKAFFIEILWHLKKLFRKMSENLFWKEII